ncbi:serine acetyltransferase [Celerinatantimonas sp. MCCC 1A17872]|uniref:serine acetyltransferase n=1 Tax=Celerinatantimonas sp. MCCC 1A17872 TaxID=3177514 RepID=UPI0038C0D197
MEFKSKYKFYYKILRKIVLQMIYHVEINPCVFDDIESIVSLRLPHPYGIIIHSKCKIGKGVTIFQFVTIGVVEKLGTSYPVISDYVYIGTGAVILGNCVIGENAKIGANSTILTAVPPNITATGIFK